MCNLFISVSETEKVVTLGELVGKVTAGSGSLAGFKEDKRNKVSLGKCVRTYIQYTNQLFCSRCI